MAWRLNVSTGTAQQGGGGSNDKDTYPGTVVIEAIHAIVAQTAVRGTWRPEYLAGEAILQLDRLPLDEHLLGAWRRAVCGTVQRVWHFYTQVRNGSGCAAAAAYGNAASASAALATKSSSSSLLLTCKENEREGKKEQKFSHFKHFPQWQQQQLIRAKAAAPIAPAPAPAPSPAHSL